jgi:DNA-3-methyladenine glycosylase I
VRRCPWPGDIPVYLSYHDQEWGVPLTDDRRLFEFLILEGAQAGLSWLTILKRRAGYRKAFADFDAEKVARFGDRDVARLLRDPGIIRNRAKVRAAVRNARAFLAIQNEFGSFSAYQWRFVDGRPVQNRWQRLAQLPATSKASDAFSKDLKARGMSFVGSTILYAHMQAVGMVNDHLTDCFRYAEVRELGAKLRL